MRRVMDGEKISGGTSCACRILGVLTHCLYLVLRNHHLLILSPWIAPQGDSIFSPVFPGCIGGDIHKMFSFPWGYFCSHWVDACLYNVSQCKLNIDLIVQSYIYISKGIHFTGKQLRSNFTSWWKCDKLMGVTLGMAKLSSVLIPYKHNFTWC